MKIRVISEFYDKFHTSTLFKVGTVLDFEEERANDIIRKKLAEPYVEEKKKAKAEPKPEPKPEPKVEQKPEPKVEPKAEPKEKAKAKEAEEPEEEKK